MNDLRLVAPLAGWALPLSAVPDPVFAQGMMGVGCAIDPVGGTLYAPCDGVVLTIHSAGHAITLASDAGAELLIHLGIDTVAMKGDGFTALIAAGARVAAGDPLIRFDLDAVVRRASAAVTPVIVTSPGWRIEGVAAGSIAVGDPLMTLVAEATAAVVPVEGETLRRTMAIGLPHGLHARPAARIVAAARDAGVTATLAVAGRGATCDSPTALLGLGASHGAEVTIAVTGANAAAAIDAIAALLTHEVDAPAPPVKAGRVATAIPAGALAGVTASPGLALGTAHWLRNVRPAIPESADDAATELARLAQGIDAVRRALAASAATPGSAGAVMAAHAAIIDDPALIDRAQARVAAGHPAAGAYLTTLEAEADTLRRLPDRRIAERADDLIDVGYRVARAILGHEQRADDLPGHAILCSDDLLPSQLIALDAARIAGIALVRGGPTSHVAILAAGLGVPMLVAIGDRLHAVDGGATVLIDADGGFLHPAPDEAVRTATAATLAARRAAEARAATAGPTATADGTRVAVFANLGSAQDAAAAAVAGAEGCGLLRTEFLFLDRQTAPDVAEQTASYSAIARKLGDRPLVIRLLDIGGDKPAPYLALPPEENPALGLRGIRIGLARPDILDTQLRAILAMPEVARCRIMLPMVADLSEVAAVRAALNRLGGGGIPLGVMIETPAAALIADLIGAHVDFMSIGSNDLTQYTLAMDRGNAAVAAGIDGLHPAVLRLIAAACDGAARHGVPVSVCGGLAADPLAAPILIGLGVRTLSVPPARIAATKALVGAVRTDAATAHARAALDLPTAADVRAHARAFAQELAA